jgi:hypothetical protein
MWSECEHGYYITPSHKCPWCFGGDVEKYTPVIGEGNGWLLEKGRLPCKRCGGPRHAGYGAFEGTAEEYWAEIEKTDHCLSCVGAIRCEQEALAIYVVAARDWSDALEMILECNEIGILDFLHKMLTHKGTEKTDVELNELLAGPVKRRLDKLEAASRGA